MTKDEALKLALEALEYLATQIKPDYEHNKAIAVIKQALAAPVQEPYGYWWIPDGSVSGLKPGMSPNTGPHTNFTVIPLYTTPPAQPAPVQEPVAWDRPIIYTPPHMAPPAAKRQHEDDK